MSTIWNRCATPGCENEKQYPAACCDQCLCELYGYGTGSGTGTGKVRNTGQLVEPVKIITHLPKMSKAEPRSMEAQLNLRVAELTERLGLLERVVESYQEAPPQAIPEKFKDLDAFTAHKTIQSFAAIEVFVQPRNTQGGLPQYCAIHAHPVGHPSDVVHLRLGGVTIAQCPQMQFCDHKCESFVSTKFYDLRYGVPVDWALVGYEFFHNAVFYLYNQHPFQVEVDIELWCDTKTPYASFTTTPGTFSCSPGAFHALPHCPLR